MTDLTDKLNAGRLYYVKKKNGKIVMRQAHLYSCLITEKATPFVDFDDNDIEKVLAPVPSYEELQELKAQLAEHKEYCCCAKNEVLVLENARLKELLKECKTKVNELLDNYAVLDEDCYFEHGHKWSEEGFKQENSDIYELLTKIEEALK